MTSDQIMMAINIVMLLLNAYVFHTLSGKFKKMWKLKSVIWMRLLSMSFEFDKMRYEGLIDGEQYRRILRRLKEEGLMGAKL